MPLGFICLTCSVYEGDIFGEIVWDIVTAAVFMFALFAFKHFCDTHMFSNCYILLSIL